MVDYVNLQRFKDSFMEQYKTQLQASKDNIDKEFAAALLIQRVFRAYVSKKVQAKRQ